MMVSVELLKSHAAALLTYSLVVVIVVNSVSGKNPLLRFSDIFPPKGCEFLVQSLHAYYTFLSTLDYKFLFNYLQL